MNFQIANLLTSLYLQVVPLKQTMFYIKISVVLKNPFAQASPVPSTNG